MTMLSSSQFSYATPEDVIWRRGLIRCIEHFTGKPRLWRLYQTYRQDHADDDFFSEAVRRLDLQVRADTEALAALPARGALIVVANHPLGVIDGIVIGHLISRVRSDFRVLVHSALCRLPEPRHHLLPIDFSNTRQAQQTNLETRQAALRDLADDRAIVIFPGGGVATARNPLSEALDLEWKTFLARLVHKGRATVLPVYIEGQSSRLFQCASQISMELRASLLFREAVKMIGREVNVHIGAPIPYERLCHMTDRRDLTEHLRRETFALRPAPSPPGALNGHRHRRRLRRPRG
jgi:putative hemolysin